MADNGIGPWEDPEMKALLRRFVNEKKTGNILPVIPVLLPGAPATIKLPLFLEEFTFPLMTRLSLTEISIIGRLAAPAGGSCAARPARSGSCH